MKKETGQSKNNLSSQSPDKFSTAAFRKQNKKRILPDAFYPRWELELLSSIIFIFILWISPDWINNANYLLASEFEVDINSSWFNFAIEIAMVGFISSFILRLIWLRLVWKWHNNKLSHGGMMFKNDTAQELRWSFLQNKKWAVRIDELAEVIFFISSIILFIAFMGYLIHILLSLLNHTMHISRGMPGVK